MGRLSTRRDRVVYHALINNSILCHKSNNYRPISVKELINYLITNRTKIKSLVNCQRNETRDFFKELLSNRIVVIRVKRHLISNTAAAGKTHTPPGTVRWAQVSWHCSVPPGHTEIWPQENIKQKLGIERGRRDQNLEW